MQRATVTILLLSIVATLESPALADSSGTVGTNYLMTHTYIDPQAVAEQKKRALAQTPNSTAANQPGAPVANSMEFPSQILRSGVSLTTTGLSPNSMQLAANIGLLPVLDRISDLQRQASESGNDQSLRSLYIKQDLADARLAARMIVQKTNLEIDATAAEIEAEKEVYNEILTTFKADRDKAIARTNALAFISNGALWAVTEALVIPTYKHAIYNVPAGIVGIPAGVVPSFASMYTFMLVNGKKKTSEVEPNMLAKLFNYPTTPEIEYPNSVWTFLNQVPAETPNSKKRLDQIIDRWIADANMSAFTDRNSKKQLDVLTASAAHKKGLTINTLTARTIMLDQLVCEIDKMKRMLLELNMVALGEKRYLAER